MRGSIVVFALLVLGIPADLIAQSGRKGETEKPKLIGVTGRGEGVLDGKGFDESAMAQFVFERTNQERKKAGLQEFTGNAALASSAREHSSDMARRGYFAHKSKGIFNRTDPRDRVEATGYNPGMVAENIAMIPTFKGQTVWRSSNGASTVDTQYYTYNEAAVMAMEKWMNSPGHRANILNPALRSLGVGVAVGVKDNVPYVYMTQNFGG